MTLQYHKHKHTHINSQNCNSLCDKLKIMKQLSKPTENIKTDLTRKTIKSTNTNHTLVLTNIFPFSLAKVCVQRPLGLFHKNLVYLTERMVEKTKSTWHLCGMCSWRVFKDIASINSLVDNETR